MKTKSAILAALAGTMLLAVAACAPGPATNVVAPSIAPGPTREARFNALPSTLQALRPQAERGDTLAQYKLALLYDKGVGGAARDPAAAYRWMRAAADGGDIVAQFGTGLFLENGLGVPKNPNEAFRWYKRSADAGYSVAENSLGRMHERGIGTTQNYAEALALYRRAAEKGNDAGENNIGVMYMEGRGVTVNPTEAIRWFMRAADRGNGTAQANLGALHVTGRGVPKDDVRAYFWLTLAAARLSGDQGTNAATQRDAAAKRLSPEAVAHVQTAAKNWKPGLGATAIARLSEETKNRPAQPSGNGTGFFVSRNGYLLTNAHVVRNCRELAIKPSADAPKPASVVAVDAANDLALLKGEFQTVDAAVFRSGAYVRQGDGIVAFGYPLASALASEGNLTTGTVTALAGLKDDTRLIQISAPIQSGNSGGAVLDVSGHVVGVVVSKLNALTIAQITGDVPQNVNFAIKSAVARGFLESNGIDIRQAASAARLDAADVGALARKFTARVDCRN